MGPLVGDCSIPMSWLCEKFVPGGEDAFHAVAGCIETMIVLSLVLCSVGLTVCELMVAVADEEGSVETCSDYCFDCQCFVTFLVPGCLSEALAVRLDSYRLYNSN